MSCRKQREDVENVNYEEEYAEFLRFKATANYGLFVVKEKSRINDGPKPQYEY